MASAYQGKIEEKADFDVKKTTGESFSVAVKAVIAGDFFYLKAGIPGYYT